MSKIDHETSVSSMLLSFKFHIYFDSSVLFALLRWRSELLCLYNGTTCL